MPIEVKTVILSADELYACDGITTVPGIVYPDHGIQALRIEDTSSDFLSLEPCCGTHVKSTSEIENFCITSNRSTKSGTFEITAVCGQRAQQVYENGETLLRTMAEVGEKLNKECTQAEYSELILTIKRMKGDLQGNDVPFTIKASALEELEPMRKRVNLKLRESMR